MFYNRKASLDGKAYRCKSCDKLAHKKYLSLQDPQRISRLSRNRMVRYRYNLEHIEFNELLTKQNYVCAICGKQPEPTLVHKGLVIDHDHTSNKIRGLLCAKCNKALGLFKDSYLVLLKAARYIKQNNLNKE